MLAAFDLFPILLDNNIPAVEIQGTPAMTIRTLLAPLALVFGLAQPAAAADALQKIHVTIPVATMIMFPLFQAQDKGFFAKEGLDVDILATNGDGPDVDALISGSVEFTVSTPNRLFTSFEQGRPLVAVMSLSTRMSIECAMNKKMAESRGITAASPLADSIRSMKDTTVAGTRPGAFTYLLLQDYAKRAGLTPQKDITLIGIGGPPSMIPALENEQIYVGCGGSPFAEVAAGRGKAIQMTHNADGKDPAFDNFLFEMVYARPDYLKQSPDVVRRFLRAFMASVRDTSATSTAAQMDYMRKRYTGVADDLLVQMMDSAKPTFSATGEVTKEQVDKAADFLISAGAIKTTAAYDKVVDNSFLPKP